MLKRVVARLHATLHRLRDRVRRWTRPESRPLVGLALDHLLAGISGHSTRVGAAQDMVAYGLEIGEVMQAGGWKTPVMVARYTERLTARRGAAAKLAMLQQRVSAARPT